MYLDVSSGSFIGCFVVALAATLVVSLVVAWAFGERDTWDGCTGNLVGAE